MCLSPRSAIFQSFHGNHFYWWRNLGEKNWFATTIVTDKLQHIKLNQLNHPTGKITLNKNVTEK